MTSLIYSSVQGVTEEEAFLIESHRSGAKADPFYIGVVDNFSQICVGVTGKLTFTLLVNSGLNPSFIPIATLLDSISLKRGVF